MTEHRQPTASFSKRFAQEDSNKTMKIELFIAHIYAPKWEPLSKKFYPKLPFNGMRRKEYWENRYRARIDGVWVGGKAKYTMFTKEQIYKKWFNF